MAIRVVRISVVPVGHAVVTTIAPRVVRYLAIPVTRLVTPAAMDRRPAIGHPGVAAPFRHPIAAMPDVAAAFPVPVARCPDVTGARRGDDLIDRRRRRRADGEAKAHAGLRCRWRKHRRSDQRRRGNRGGGKSSVEGMLHHDLPPGAGPVEPALGIRYRACLRALAIMEFGPPCCPNLAATTQTQKDRAPLGRPALLQIDERFSASDGGSSDGAPTHANDDAPTRDAPIAD